MTFPSFPLTSSLPVGANRQKYLLAALLVLLLIGAGIFWYAYFREETISLFQPEVPLPRNVSIDLNALDHPIFEELGTPPSEIPLPAGAARPNPFTRNP